MHPAPARTWHEIALKLSELMEKVKTVIIVRLRQDEICNEPSKHNASQLLIKQATNFGTKRTSEGAYGAAGIVRLRSR